MDTRSDYKDRFEKAMRDSGKDAHAIASDLDVSYQAVMKVLGGTTKMLKASHNSVAALAMRVDTDWLATGNGNPARHDHPAVSAKALEVAQLFDLIDPGLQVHVEALVHALQPLGVSRQAVEAPYTEPKIAPRPGQQSSAESAPVSPSSRRGR